ncbi:MAG: sigma-54-dependent Fis family transcriptional regulator [Chitinispirillaceae bacterium]|nr:sigma-54-dependent Fis family transcriptional regulator [Chitinispirillaceae bacterium]
MKGMKILIVDDETEIRTTLNEILSEEGYEVLLAGSFGEAQNALGTGVDLVLLDIKLGEENGIDLLKSIKAVFPRLPVVMITGHGSVSLASQAFKLGAHDFLEKPLRLLQVRTCIRNALEGVALRRELERQKSGPMARPIYASKAMNDLFAQAAKLASIKEPVVIIGPSGSGKELLARSLHYQGNRAHGPFVATNAASMPVNLAEDELFGHEKGAFTGADKMRQGCFERANGGTLFLDEIGDMDLQIQAKLLRVLEHGIVERLGGSRPLQVLVRLVCATHKDLEAMVRAGAFRNDLWYRISAFILTIPPLEKRQEDIPLLACHFLEQLGADLGVRRSFGDDALNLLAKRRYPGNVRELKHLVARLAVFSEKQVIDASDVDRFVHDQPAPPAGGEPAEDAPPDTAVDYRRAKEQFERQFFGRAIERAKGNITAAAQAIGMAQSNFSRKMKQLGLR